jgi:integrase/recombinase XerD
MNSVLSAGYASVYESFLGYKQRRASAQGYVALKKNTMKLLKWFEHEEIPLNTTTIQDCIHYRNDLGNYAKKDGLPLHIGTIHNRLKAGKALFQYLYTTGQVPSNPFQEIQYPRLPEHISRNVLNEARMGFLLDNLQKFDTPPTKRERLAKYRLHVVAELLYATGLRISEAAALEPANIDTASRLVYVQAGKGMRTRTAFMTGFASEVMEQYLKQGRKKVLATYGREYGHTVFGAHPERLMSLVNRELKKTCAELDLPLITSHAFRHSLGTHLLHAGCDMRYIQGILGHEALQTTQVYTRVDKDDLKESLDRFHPRRWNDR